jgi:hypothetical protein
MNQISSLWFTTIWNSRLTTIWGPQSQCSILQKHKSNATSASAIRIRNEISTNKHLRLGPPLKHIDRPLSILFYLLPWHQSNSHNHRLHFPLSFTVGPVVSDLPDVIRWLHHFENVLAAHRITPHAQLSNAMDAESRPASFLSFSSAGSAIKLGFTTTTNTTSAITQALTAPSLIEPVSQDAGSAQVLLQSNIQCSKLNGIHAQTHSHFRRAGPALAALALSFRCPRQSPAAAPSEYPRFSV